jgi:hypothetical protein
VDLGFTGKVYKTSCFHLKVADSLWKAKKIVTSLNQMWLSGTGGFASGPL